MLPVSSISFRRQQWGSHSDERRNSDGGAGFSTPWSLGGRTQKSHNPRALPVSGAQAVRRGQHMIATRAQKTVPHLRSYYKKVKWIAI